MYNMQTSMRLGGGRVDERKDYGRSAQRQRCFGFPLYFVYGWKAKLRNNYNRMSICSTNIAGLPKFKRTSFWKSYWRFMVRGSRFKRHSSKRDMEQQFNHRESFQRRQKSTSRNIWLTRNEVIA